MPQSSKGKKNVVGKAWILVPVTNHQKEHAITKIMAKCMEDLPLLLVTKGDLTLSKLCMDQVMQHLELATHHAYDGTSGSHYRRSDIIYVTFFNFLNFLFFVMIHGYFI